MSTPHTGGESKASYSDHIHRDSWLPIQSLSIKKKGGGAGAQGRVLSLIIITLMEAFTVPSLGQLPLNCGIVNHSRFSDLTLTLDTLQEEMSCFQCYSTASASHSMKFLFFGFFQKQSGKDVIEPMVTAHQTCISQVMT